MLELNGVYAGYYGTVMLKNICLTLKDSKITGIIGPNGCGKSTLLRVTAGLMRPISAVFCWIAKKRGNRTPGIRPACILPAAGTERAEHVRKRAGYARETSVPDLPRRYSAADRRAVLEAMELTGAIKYRDRNLAGLSGGERQKAYIAMSVAQDTDVLLLDEPTTYLDIHHQF
jgi:iron complex transport system ATP-binding protein